MKKILSIFTIALGTLILAIGTVQAEDVTDTIDLGITGTPRCEMSIGSSDLTITAPTSMGPSTTTFTNSPVTFELLDNDTSSAVALKVKISSSLPSQYGTDNVYYISNAMPSVTPAVDSDFTSGIISASWQPTDALTTSDKNIMEVTSDGGDIFHVTGGQAMSLVVNANKRVRGDTSDSFTIQYTFVDSSD